MYLKKKLYISPWYIQNDIAKKICQIEYLHAKYISKVLAWFYYCALLLNPYCNVHFTFFLGQNSYISAV